MSGKQNKFPCRHLIFPGVLFSPEDATANLSGNWKAMSMGPTTLEVVLQESPDSNDKSIFYEIVSSTKCSVAAILNATVREKWGIADVGAILRGNQR